jgi:hypothetical protein
MHAIRDGWEPLSDFSLALAQEQKRIDAHWEIAWHYTKMGFYYQQLQRYYQVFDSSRIKTFLYDDLLNDPLKLIRDIFRFINVDDTFIPNISIRPNVSGRIRSRLAYDLTNRLFLKPNPLKWLSRQLLPEKIRWRFTTRLRNLNIDKEPFPEEIRAKLVPLFTSDITQLQGLIGRDLSRWLV